jgi:hypothetical protein
MVSLPELENRKRYWLEIWHGDSAWKTGGPRGLLPIGECPQIASQQIMLKKNIFWAFADETINLYEASWLNKSSELWKLLPHNYSYFSSRGFICGHSLVGSNPRGPPVFQALSPCQISSQYLKPFSSSGSDTIQKCTLKYQFKETQTLQSLSTFQSIKNLIYIQIIKSTI